MTVSLGDPGLLETRASVAGRWEAGTATFEVRNPATGECVARVARVGTTHE